MLYKKTACTVAPHFFITSAPEEHDLLQACFVLFYTVQNRNGGLVVLHV